MKVRRDLVCGKVVQPGPETPTVAFGSECFLFCSEACRDRFIVMPVPYLRRAWSRNHAGRIPSEQFVP